MIAAVLENEMCEKCIPSKIKELADPDGPGRSEWKEKSPVNDFLN